LRSRVRLASIHNDKAVSLAAAAGMCGRLYACVCMALALHNSHLG
jgi:hypothetical protein